MPRRGPPSPAGPRRGETIREWYFERPARYRVVIDDGDVPEAITVWAMSPGDALDAALVYVDSIEKINVRSAPAHVEEIPGLPEPNDVKATDDGWPFAPPPGRPRLDRQDVADAAIFVSILGIAGSVIGLYAFALFSVLDGDWVRAVIAAAVASVPATGLALFWLNA